MYSQRYPEGGLRAFVEGDSTEGLKQARLEAAHNKRIASILKELPEDELDSKGDIHTCTVELPNCKFFPLWAGYVFLNAWGKISCAYVHV